MLTLVIAIVALASCEFTCVHEGGVATCTEGGHSAYTKCDRCGHTEGKEVYEALGHAWVSQGFDEENVETLTCSNCEETKTQKVQLPEAVVTPVENSDLTFALNFGIKGASIVDGELVIDFDCGVYFTDAFLAANPDMVVTLELIVFTEDAEGNIEDSNVLAKNVFTVPVADAE